MLLGRFVRKGAVTSSRSMVGLFAGIGGLELGGLSEHGWNTELLCEIDPGAQAVLRSRFADVRCTVTSPNFARCPVTSNWWPPVSPCQDLSQAGKTAGITGARSGLVDEVFRLVKRKKGPRWLLIENVPFMLQLGKGAAMRHITDASKTSDTPGRTGWSTPAPSDSPQRRQRVIMLASRTDDPREILFGQDAGERLGGDPADYPPCGFYWTEGTRGLGWAVNAVPTLKGGSSVGIPPSQPAVRLPSGEIVTPGLVDAERLQGFDPDWTLPSVEVPGLRHSHRWKLVGNAVSVRMASWVGGRLSDPIEYDAAGETPLEPGDAWPSAAWGP